MDRRKFFRLIGAGSLLGLLKAKAQGSPWREETFAPLRGLGTPLQEYGTRSPFEEEVIRYISPGLRTRHSGASFAPWKSWTGSSPPTASSSSGTTRGPQRWTPSITAW